MVIYWVLSWWYVGVFVGVMVCALLLCVRVLLQLGNSNQLGLCVIHLCTCVCVIVDCGNSSGVRVY